MSSGGKKKGKKGSERTLTQELASFLSKVLVPDLRERAKVHEVRRALEKRYLHEKAASRTADHLVDWVEQTVEQVGAAWVLSCLFIRTLEDRELLGQRRLAGLGAKDSYSQFIEIAPAMTARDYMLLVFREVASLPAAKDVLGPQHNPAWRLSPSHEAAEELLEFFQEEDALGNLKWTFTGTDTRFLGDIYQDLSAEVRKRYALLQTPQFVEKFILDLTIEPAIDEFGLEELRIIDPTCGSGHFLLGSFERLFEKRRLKAPGVDAKEHAVAALMQVYGVDLNPYAVAIARFRLTLAFLQKAAIRRLANAPQLALNLVVADSLLYGGRHQANLSDMHEDEGRVHWGDGIFELEDPAAARRVFAQQYHAVVGNPPYITCKDQALREAYRSRYDSCYRTYALAAPFCERFFELAAERGFVGIINSNSFMKREFGRPLIEKVLPRYELTRVIDTSGAYIPGHGTPTVLLFGRNCKSHAVNVTAVLGKRGEPSTPTDGAQGLVWSSIVAHHDEVGFENEYISVADMSRSTLSSHPWSLGGGGVAELRSSIEKSAEGELKDVVEDVGFASFTGLDDVFIAPAGAFERQGVPRALVRPVIIGESVRDWSLSVEDDAFVPYLDKNQDLIPLDASSRWARFLWPYRTILENISSFGGKTRTEEGQDWWAWYRWQAERYRSPMRIVFAAVATHNHFMIERGGNVFKQSAPIVILKPGATEREYLALLAYMNSSTACFWLKQVCHAKTNHTDDRPETFEPGTIYYDFSASSLKPLPLPPRSSWDSLSKFGRAFESLEQIAKESQPSTVVARILSSNENPEEILKRAEASDVGLRDRRVALQEDLDWSVYNAFLLCSEEEGKAVFLSEGTIPPEQRTFVAEQWEQTVSESVRKTLTKRREKLLSDKQIALLENAENKRRWIGSGRGSFALQAKTFRERCIDGVSGVYMSHAEELLRQEGRILSVREVVERLGAAPHDARLLEWLAGGSDVVAWFSSQVEASAVPYLAALRFTDLGLEKLPHWQSTWDCQRRVDNGAHMAVPIPPRYDQDDYQQPVYWRLRGKLDIAKERFISYLNADGEGADTRLIGWSGWSHIERANALSVLYQERKKQNGWGAEQLTPLLAGLYELVPWLQQWHNEPNPDFNGERLGDYYSQFVTEEARSLGLTLDDLRNWRPTKAAAKKRATKKKASASDTEGAA